MLAAAFAVLAACARTEHTPVELELDIDAALPAEASTVRICETDGLARSFPARDGRYALPGVSADAPELTVDVLDGDVVFARVGPLLLEEAYVLAPLAPCEACEPCLGGGSAASEPVALGVRFQAADDRGP